MILRLLFFFAFIGAALYIAPRLAAPATAPTPPRAVANATVPPALASGITTVDAALKQATQSGKNVPISLRVTDADLTAAAQPYFPQTYAGITVMEPLVRIGPAFTLSAKASSFGLTGALVASGTPYASDGRLGVRLDNATIAGVALPDAARTQLQQQMQSALNSAMPARLQVASVSIAQGVATISGLALP
jgi:hypothetical protein